MEHCIFWISFNKISSNKFNINLNFYFNFNENLFGKRQNKFLFNAAVFTMVLLCFRIKFHDSNTKLKPLFWIISFEYVFVD